MPRWSTDASRRTRDEGVASVGRTMANSSTTASRLRLGRSTVGRPDEGMGNRRCSTDASMRSGRSASPRGLVSTGAVFRRIPAGVVPKWSGTLGRDAGPAEPSSDPEERGTAQPTRSKRKGKVRRRSLARSMALRSADDRRPQTAPKVEVKARPRGRRWTRTPVAKLAPQTSDGSHGNGSRGQGFQRQTSDEAPRQCPAQETLTTYPSRSFVSGGPNDADVPGRASSGAVLEALSPHRAGSLGTQGPGEKFGRNSTPRKFENPVAGDELPADTGRNSRKEFSE